jgi:hypothetical protein
MLLLWSAQKEEEKSKQGWGKDHLRIKSVLTVILIDFDTVVGTTMILAGGLAMHEQIVLISAFAYGASATGVGFTLRLTRA